MSIDGDWELVGDDSEGLGDTTSISGETGKMLAVGMQIGTYTFKELEDVVKGFKGECKSSLLEGDVEENLCNGQIRAEGRSSWQIKVIEIFIQKAC